MPVRPASSSCDQPRRCRHQRSCAAKLCCCTMTTCQVVEHPDRDVDIGAAQRTGGAVGGVVRRPACNRLEQPWWNGGSYHTLPGGQCRSADARDTALGYRPLCRRACCDHSACALASAERLAKCRRIGDLLLWVV